MQKRISFEIVSYEVSIGIETHKENNPVNNRTQRFHFDFNLYK